MSIKFNPCQTCRGCSLPGRSELSSPPSSRLCHTPGSAHLPAAVKPSVCSLSPDSQGSGWSLTPPHPCAPCTLSFLFPSCLRGLPFDFCLCLLYLLLRMTAIGFPVLSISPRSRGSLGTGTMLCSLWCPQYPAGCPTGAFWKEGWKKCMETWNSEHT